MEWDFLDFVQQKKRFNVKWRSWIRDCLKSVSFLVLINGRPRGKFRHSRGLRQGDPLSPFLFTLMANASGRLVDKAICQDLL